MVGENMDDINDGDRLEDDSGAAIIVDLAAT